LTSSCFYRYLLFWWLRVKEVSIEMLTSRPNNLILCSWTFVSRSLRQHEPIFAFVRRKTRLSLCHRIMTLFELQPFRQMSLSCVWSFGQGLNPTCVNQNYNIVFHVSTTKTRSLHIISHLSQGIAAYEPLLIEFSLT